MLGETFIFLGFLAALSAAFFYFMTMRRQSKSMLLAARSSYILSAIAQLTASNILLYLILTHQFQYTYVWNYSSTTLPLPLLISTFYAGQEGSFMLWSLYMSLMGIVLLRYTAKRDYEPSVMAVFSFILAFLFLMSVVKNPFTYIWETFPKDVVHQGIVPAGITRMMWLDQAKSIWAVIPVDGRGLNPLLQNYWMVIHPQILFLGFSSMAVPYAFAVGGLLKKEYTSWIRIAAPWTVFGAMVLGTGIILGGYWAYETLGWGGFWGWDPVENSSLIPWLVCIASIHTMLGQRKSGSFVRINFVLSMLSFLLVLYSTFLTRSGVLGDTSVHSFVDPGIWAYRMLMAFICVFTALGFGLFFRRLREMPTIPVRHSFLSREYILFIGATALTSVAILVAVGTSSPIITSILKGKPSAMDVSYYVETNLPLGIIITFLSGFAQLLWWKNTKARSLSRQIAGPAILALFPSVLILLMGRESVLIHLFVYGASFSLFANLQVIYEIIRGNPRFAGGAIAHIGISLMCIGFVTSAQYSEKKTVSLEQDKPMDLLGYQMTYRGYHQRDDGKYAFTVEVEQEGRKHLAFPTMYFSEQTQSVIRNPDIINFLRRDVYIESLIAEDTSTNEEQRIELQKDISRIYEGLSLTFAGFDFTENQRAAMMEGKSFEILAVLHVLEGKKDTTISLKMKRTIEQATFFPTIYQTKEHKRHEFTFTRIIPPQGDTVKAAVEVAVRDLDKHTPQKKETLTIEATIKPFINLVWIGTVILIFGFIAALTRRFSKSQHQQ